MCHAAADLGLEGWGRGDAPEDRSPLQVSVAWEGSGEERHLQLCRLEMRLSPPILLPRAVRSREHLIYKGRGLSEIAQAAAIQMFWWQKGCASPWCVVAVPAGQEVPVENWESQADGGAGRVAERGLAVSGVEGSYPEDRCSCCLSDREEMFKLVIVGS